MLSSSKFPGIKGLFSKKKPNSTKSTWVLVISAVVIVALGSALVSFLLTRNSNQQSITTDQRINTVALKKSNNQPIDLLIKAGEYVQFNSADGEQHQVVQGHNSNTTHGENMLDSGVFDGDEGYKIQFTKIGKYEFHDNNDHDYTITVIVYDPNNKDASTIQR